MPCSCEGKELPVIRWQEGMEIPQPPDHVPQYVDLGLGFTVDEARLPWILDALLAEHPESERLRAEARAHPGLDIDRHHDQLVCVILAATGESIGMFDD